MRTPISSIIFFISQILIYITGLKDQSEQKQQVIRYIKLINSQLQLTQGFVNDLLDLR